MKFPSSRDFWLTPRLLPMAMEVIRRFLLAFVNEKVITAKKERCSRLREAATSLHSANFGSKAILLADEIVSSVRLCIVLDEGSRIRNFCVMREGAQKAFHALRTGKLLHLWNDFMAEQGLLSYDHFLPETVSQMIFDDTLSSAASSSSQISVTEPQASKTLTGDKENAIRFASGFVPHHLLKRYRKDASKEGQATRQCLQGMAGKDQAEFLSDHHLAYTFYDYTTVWLEKVDRGNLFEVSDAAYQLFLAIELELREFFS